MPKAEVLLVGYDGEQFPGVEASGSFLRVGCNDALIPVEIPVVSTRLQSVLAALSQLEAPEGLYNPIKEKGLSFMRLDEKRGGKAIVYLSGSPLLGGICDTPRLKAQIEETIRLYTDDFEIWLNGSAREYQCLGDESGLCK